jgi:hypothetical protein
MFSWLVQAERAMPKPAGSTIADQIKAPTGKETKSTL